MPKHLSHTFTQVLLQPRTGRLKLGALGVSDVLDGQVVVTCTPIRCPRVIIAFFCMQLRAQTAF